MPYVNRVRGTQTSLTLNLAGLSNAPSYYSSVYISCNGETKGTSSFYNSGGSTYCAGIEFTGLKPGTSYYCGATVYYKGQSQTFYDTFETDPSPDTTNPNCSVDYDKSGWIQSSTFKGWAKASDYESGVVKVWLALCYSDGGAIQQKTWGGDGGEVIGNGDYIHEFNTPGYGTYQIKATVKDKAGRTTSSYKDITIGRDITGPSITSRWVEQQGDKIVGFMRATDNQSGTGGCYYYISAPNDKNTLGPSKYVSGANTSYSFTTDAYGNPLKNGSRYWISMGVHDKTTDKANFTWTLDPKDGFLFKKPRPGNWTWSSKARKAFTGSGEDRLTSNLTVLEWNNFVDKVIAFSEWNSTGSSNDSIYGLKLSDCKMWIPGNDVLKANYFNRVRYAVGSLTSTGISDKKKGDPVNGSYFITLESCLNKATYSEGEREAYVLANPIIGEEREKVYSDLFDELIL